MAECDSQPMTTPLSSPTTATTTQDSQQQPSCSTADRSALEPPTERIKRLRHLLTSPTDQLVSPVSRVLRAQQKPKRRTSAGARKALAELQL